MKLNGFASENNLLFSKENDVLHQYLKEFFGSKVYRSTLYKINVKSIDSNASQVSIEVANDFIKKELTMCEKYSSKIISILNYNCGYNLNKVEFVSEEEVINVTPKDDTVTEISVTNTKQGIGNNVNPRYRLNNFIRSNSNNFAYNLANKIANGSLAQLFSGENFIFLYGETGNGKTHLLQAIANYIISSTPRSKVKYFSATNFMHHFIKSIQTNTITNFKEELYQLDVLLVDDVHLLAGKSSTSKEMLLLLNHLIEANKLVVMTSNQMPNNLANLDNGFKARMQSALIAKIEQPDNGLRYDILKYKATISGVEIEDSILASIAKSEYNIRCLEATLNQLILHTRIGNVSGNINSHINLDNMLVENKSYTLSLPLIKSKVAEFYGIEEVQLESTARGKKITVARAMGMFLSRELTTHSLTEIGLCYGGRSHATVIHSIKNIRDNQQEFSGKITQIKAILNKASGK